MPADLTLMCKVDPNHVSMLRFMASILLLVVFLSLLFGKTYYRRIIVRADEPTVFWVNIVCNFLLGMMILVGTYVCQ